MEQKIEEARSPKPIDIVAIFKKIHESRRSFFIALPVTFVSSCLLILCVPRYYTATVKLSPELSSSGTSSLVDLASSFGFDIGGGGEGTDAIFPDLYPDLINTNDFITTLFDIPVKSIDGEILTTYYDYMDKYQKEPWWSSVFHALRKLMPENNVYPANGDGSGKTNPFMLTKRQDKIVNDISRNIACSIDKKTYVIYLTVEAQDPLIAATMVDSVTQRLQDFITTYRTSKAKNDYEYFRKLTIEAKEKYEQARNRYGAFSDANQDIYLESVRLKQNDLENDMQLCYNNYTAFASQEQQALARIQERTPAFTTLQSASVPIKPAGPKRMLFVLGMCFIVFTVLSVYSARDILFDR